MSLYGYICLIFNAIQTLMITVQMLTTYSRDQLLPLRASATLLNYDQRLSHSARPTTQARQFIITDVDKCSSQSHMRL